MQSEIKGSRVRTQMSGMMHTMANEMMQMSRQMSKGDMDAATRQRMQEHMRDMAGMM